MHSKPLLALVALVSCVFAAGAVNAQPARTYQLDPFAQATAGYPRCPEAKLPVLTEEGCVRSAAQKKALERLVKKQPDVAIVWNETMIGLPPKK